MPLQSTRGAIAPYVRLLDNVTISSAILDANGEYCGGVFQVPQTGTLNKIGLRVAAVTTADVIHVTLETVSAANGAPSGIFYRNGAATACTFQDTGDTVTCNGHGLLDGDEVQFATIVTTTGISIDTTYYVVSSTANTFQVSATYGGGALALTTNGTGTFTAGGRIPTPATSTTYWVTINGANGVNVKQGDLVAIKCILEYVDGNLSINYGCPAGGSLVPYSFTYLGAALALSNRWIDFGLEYSTGIVSCPGMLPGVASASTLAYGNDHNPEKCGLVFQVPYACRLIGAWIYIDLDGDCNIAFYDSDQATLLEPLIAFDKDQRGSTSGSHLHVQLASPHILLPNTNYRISVEPSSTTHVTLQYLVVTDDGAVVALNGLPGGSTWMYTTATGVPANEGSWTNTATRRMMIVPEFDQLDDGYGFPHFGDMSGGKY